MKRLAPALAALALIATLTACDDGMTPEQCVARGGHVARVPAAPIYIKSGSVLIPVEQKRDACLLADGSEVSS